MQWRKVTTWALAAVLLGLLASGGCSRIRRVAVYRNQDADLKYYQKIGVAPFANYSVDKLAGEKMQECVLTELLRLKRFEIASPGEFSVSLRKAINGSGVSVMNLTSDQLKRLGESTGVQGVIEAVVQEFSLVRVGQDSYPLISMTVRLVDVNTGTVIWQTNISEQGGPTLPVVSIGETYTLGMLAVKISRTLANQIKSKVF